MADSLPGVAKGRGVVGVVATLLQLSATKMEMCMILSPASSLAGISRGIAAAYGCAECGGMAQPRRLSRCAGSPTHAGTFVGVCREIREYGLSYYVLCTRDRVVWSRRVDFVVVAQSVVRECVPRRGRWCGAWSVGAARVDIFVIRYRRAGRRRARPSST